MSFKAVLEISGKKYRVLHFSYSLNQNIDAFGRPSSGVHGGTVTLEVESTDSSALAELACDPFKHVDGKVTFSKRDSEQKMKEMTWKEGYLVNYTEAFTNLGESPMTEHFTFSAKEVKMGNAEHKNEWPV